MITEHVGMAHFAGTGPAGAVCSSCEHWVTNQTGKKMVCAQYRRMTGDDKKAVPSGTASCRYFEQRKDA